MSIPACPAVHRLLIETFSKFFGGDRLATADALTPAVDIYETDRKILLSAELLRVDPNYVEARFELSTTFSYT